jgi:hypothetical protein
MLILKTTARPQSTGIPGAEARFIPPLVGASGSLSAFAPRARSRPSRDAGVDETMGRWYICQTKLVLVRGCPFGALAALRARCGGGAPQHDSRGGRLLLLMLGP